MKTQEVRQAASDGTLVIGVAIQGGIGGCREVEHEGVPVESKQINYEGARMWLVDGRLFSAHCLHRIPSCPNAGWWLVTDEGDHTGAP